MTTLSASYLSAISLMLAAYGFFYSLYRERIEEGLHAGTPLQAKAGVEGQIRKVKKARSAALLLGLVPLAVGLVFLPPAVEEVEAACRLGFSLAHYSAIDTAFCIIVFAWFVIALIVLSYVRSLCGDLGKLRKKLGELA